MTIPLASRDTEATPPPSSYPVGFSLSKREVFSQ